MAITVTAQRSGTSANYLRYLAQKPVKSWKNKETALLDLALTPFDSNFVKLQVGDYITINSTKYPKWFTGFVTNDPGLEYLGSSGSTPKYGYKYKLSADDYILNLKQIGIMPPFFNLSYGRIIKVLAERLAPGFFNTTNVQDGPVVAVYQPRPEQKFLDIVNEFMDSGKYIFYANDKKLYFLPQDDPAIIDLSFSNSHFTPARLQLEPVTTPDINDVIVFGELEPQTYVHEYFVGTGVDAEFPLVSNVFGVEDSILLDEQFGGTPDASVWEVSDPPADYLQISNGYLNILGGVGDGTNGVKISTINAFPMEGRYRVIQGEWDFISSTANGTSGKSGIIGGFWSQTPNLSNTGCLYGLAVVKSGSNIILRPILNGVIDTTQDFTIDTTKRYVIRTLVEFFRLNRLVNTYNYIDSAGNVVSLNGTSTADDVHWQTLISEINPANGSVVRQFETYNLGTVNNTAERYAVFCPVISDNLHATVSNISVGTPVNATLEVREEVQVNNASFENWITDTQPKDWEDYINVFREDEFSNSGNACKFVPDGGDSYITQVVGEKLVTGESYRVTLRAQKEIGATVGNLKVYLQSASLSYTSTPFSTAVSALTSDYVSYEGALVTSLPASASDMKLVVQIDGGTDGVAIWVDDLIVFGDWKPKLVGPNQIDALDGLTPAATIVTGNDSNRSSITGTVQYNTGQNKLTFFKDTASLTSDVPAKYHLVRLSYRAAGYSIGRVVNISSVSSQATAWGDNGYRSIIRSDINPKPRTSQECELAAKAVLLTSGNRYEGSYEQWSEYFSAEPTPRMLVRFTDHPELAVNYIQQIDEVVTTLESSTTEYFNHKISFGAVDRVKQLLDKIDNPTGVYQKRSGQPSPTVVDIASVGTNHAADVPYPYLVGWDDDEIFINTNEAAGTNCVFEARYTDDSWGIAGSKNLLSSSSSQTITVPRTRRGKVIFIRRKNTVTGALSRYSSCLHVDFPVTVSESTQDPVVIAADVPPDLVQNTSLVFDGSLSGTWGFPDENGNRPLGLVISYNPPNPLGTFEGVVVYAVTTNGVVSLGKKELPSGYTTGSGVGFSAVISSIAAGDNLSIRLVSYSAKIENDLATSPYRTMVVPALTTGATSGIEYADLVTGVVASRDYGFLEDGSQAYRFTGSFTEPIDTKYAGCKVVAFSTTSSAYIEVADCPQGRPSFTTDLWAINLTSENFTLYFISYDTSGRANTIQTNTPKVTSIVVEKQLGSSGMEYADRVTSFVADKSYSFTESGDQKYRFVGSLVHPTSDPRYKGCTIVARTNNLSCVVSVGNNANLAYWVSGSYFGPEWLNKTITINGVDRIITEWLNSVTIRLNHTYSGAGFTQYNATLSLNEDVNVADVYPGTTTFSTDEWAVNYASETFILYARSFDTAGRLNTIQSGVTPSQTVTITRLSGSAGLEVDSVGGVTVDNSGSPSFLQYTLVTTPMGETMWYISGTFIEPLDPRYGGCSIILVNAVDPTKSEELAFISKNPNGPTTVKYKTKLLTAGLGSVKIAWLSVDTNGRANTYVFGTTQEAIINGPNQGTTVNAAYISPGSLQTAAFASTIRPTILFAALPSLPDSTYPAGTIGYHTGEGRLYKVNSSGTGWAYAIDGAKDIISDSITAGAIAAGAISTSELTTNEILVGGGGGKPIRFRVNDSSNNQVAFIGDNGAGFIGAYCINLRVGNDINNPNISASSSGVSITNVPSSYTATDSSLVKINSTFDGTALSTAGVYIQDAGNNSYNSMGYNYTNIKRLSYGRLYVSGETTSYGNTALSLKLYDSNNNLKVRIIHSGPADSYPNTSYIEIHDGTTMRKGYTGNFGYLDTLGVQRIAQYVGGILWNIG